MPRGDVLHCKKALRHRDKPKRPSRSLPFLRENQLLRKSFFLAADSLAGGNILTATESGTHVTEHILPSPTHPSS